MRVVMISPYVPFDGIDHAGGAYLNAYLKLAVQTRSIDLFAPRSPENERAAGLHATSARIHLLDVPPAPSTRIGAVVWRARNVRQGLTAGWQVLQAMRESQALNDACRHGDLIEIHWAYLLPALGHLPLEGRAVVAFPYDVAAQVFERRASITPFPRNLAVTFHASRILRQEVEYLNRTAAVFLFSDKDRSLLSEAGLRVATHILHPLVEVPPVPAAITGSTTVLFAAAMHRPENIDGIRWFLSTAWPTIKQRVPSAKLVIAGSNPPTDLSNAASGVTVTGYVDDFASLYATARVAVVPLRTGAGLKFKVAQAMLWGLPVVTTPIGAEGIVEAAGLDVFASVSREPAVLAETCIQLLTDDAMAHDVGARARAWALGAYDSEKSIAGALEVTARVVQGPQC